MNKLYLLRTGFLLSIFFTFATAQLALGDISPTNNNLKVYNTSLKDANTPNSANAMLDLNIQAKSVSSGNDNLRFAGDVVVMIKQSQLTTFIKSDVIIAYRQKDNADNIDYVASIKSIALPQSFTLENANFNITAKNGNYDIISQTFIFYNADIFYKKQNLTMSSPLFEYNIRTGQSRSLGNKNDKVTVNIPSAVDYSNKPKK